jgi:hypothetical protein
MDTFRDMIAWRPPYQSPGVPHAVMAATTDESDAQLFWLPSGSAELETFARQFLEDYVSRLSESDLSSEVSFVYVVFSRQPEPSDTDMRIGQGTPVMEVGFGSPPAAPEEWPLVELRTLLAFAIQELRRKP